MAVKNKIILVLIAPATISSIFLFLNRDRTSIEVEILNPPAIYRGKQDMLRIGKETPQLLTSLALVESPNIEESRNWITAEFAKRYSITNRPTITPEVLKTQPEGAIYAIVKIKKAGRQSAIIIDGALPIEKSYYYKAQPKPLYSFTYEGHRWLASGAYELPYRNIINIINSTPLNSLQLDLNKADINELLKEHISATK